MRRLKSILREALKLYGGDMRGAWEYIFQNYQKVGKKPYGKVSWWEELKKAYIHVLYIELASPSWEKGESPIGCWNYVSVHGEYMEKERIIDEMMNWIPIGYYELFKQNNLFAAFGVEERKMRKDYVDRILHRKEFYRIADDWYNYYFYVIKSSGEISGEESLQWVGIDWDNIDEDRAYHLLRKLRRLGRVEFELSPSGRGYHVRLYRVYDFAQHMNIRREFEDDEKRIFIDHDRYQNGLLFNILYNIKHGFEELQGIQF